MRVTFTFSNTLQVITTLFVVLLSQTNLFAQPESLKDYGIQFSPSYYDVPEATDKTYTGGIVYIDPSVSSSGDGSIESPLKSWPSSLNSNTAYLQKTGTSTSTSTLDINASNVLLGAYGSGSKPEVTFDGLKLRKDNCVVRDLRIPSRIDIYGNHTWVFNNDFDGKGRVRDIVINWAEYNKIIGNEIHNTLNEGIYAQGLIGGAGNEYAYNHIHHINVIWYPGATQEYADGDGIQISTCRDIHIHHNVIDRSNSGNKFCIIVRDTRGYLEGEPMDVLIENNVLFMPLSTSEGGAGIYLEEPQNTVIRYNKIIQTKSDDNLTAIYSSQDNGLEIYGNLITGVFKDIRMPNGDVNAYHNTIVNVRKTTASTWRNCNNNILSRYDERLSSTNLFVDTEGATTLFNNHSANDYTLKPGDNNPALDAVPESEYIYNWTKDMNGVLVPQNGFPDYGAFEYNLGQTPPTPTPPAPPTPPVDTTSPVAPTDTTTIPEPTPPTPIPTPETNQEPVVDVRLAPEAYKGMVYTIDASNSYDPDNDALSFKWSIPEEIAASSINSPTIEILPTENADSKSYVLTLSVSDGSETVYSAVNIAVNDYDPNARKLSFLSVEASDFQDDNFPENIYDNNLETRWSADGDGQWLLFELDEYASISHFEVSFFNSGNRKTFFDIYASSDKEDWEIILDNSTSCGFAPDMHAYGFPDTKASTLYKYIKLVGHMNSENTWNSFNEFIVYGVDESALSSNAPSIEDIVEVYPNPAVEDVYVNLNQESTIRIVDISGKISHTQEGFNGENLIDYSFSNGIYFIQIIRDKQLVSARKLVVK